MVRPDVAGIVWSVNPLGSVTGDQIGLSVHVIGAIAGVGPLFVQPLLLRHVRRRDPSAVGGVMTAMLWVSRALVTPGLTLLLLAGLYLVGSGQGEFADPWVSYGLAAVIVMLGLVGAVIIPRLRKGAALAEDGDVSGEEFGRISKTLEATWSVCVLLAIVAVFLMYIQPS